MLKGICNALFISVISLALSCFAGSVNKTTGEPYYVGQVNTMDDVVKWNGENVKIEGTFVTITGDRSYVKTVHGLNVFLSDFDYFQKGDDWMKYKDTQVIAIGRIRMYVNDIEGYNMPSLIISYFKPSE